MKALRDVLGSRYAGWAAVLLAGLAACQGVEFGVGVKPAVPPPDPAVAKQVEEARTAVAEAERKTKEAGQLAADAEAARAAAVATAADIERKVAAGEATQGGSTGLADRRPRLRRRPPKRRSGRTAPA